MPNIPNGGGTFPLAGLLMAAPTVSSHVGSQPLGQKESNNKPKLLASVTLTA